MGTVVLSQLFAGKYFSIAAWQVVAVGIFYSWAIFFGKLKTGLILSYFLVVYWVLVTHRIFWVDFFGGQFVGIFSYGAVCLIMIIVGLVGFFWESH